MAFITLTKGYRTEVDDSDFDNLSVYKWCALEQKRKDGTSRIYAVRAERGLGYFRQILLHREIMGFPIGLVVDHIDLDTLNNKKSNLRLVSIGENTRNCRKINERDGRKTSSRYRGVNRASYCKNPWRAQINVEGKRTSLGYFISEDDAARAYNNAAILVYGTCARLNVIE